VERDPGYASIEIENPDEIYFGNNIIFSKLKIFEAGKITLIAARTGIATAAAITGTNIAGLRLRYWVWFGNGFVRAGVCLGGHENVSVSWCAGNLPHQSRNKIGRKSWLSKLSATL
jgi:hypothetical protein